MTRIKPVRFLPAIEDNRDIGIFDSGFGGLTVLSELRKKFPDESISYISDTANVPYGEKTRKMVVKHTLDSIAAFMQKVNLKILILACNTATTCAISSLQKMVKIPVVGVIDPGVSCFLKHKNINSVAILGTTNTIKSKIYEKKIKLYGYNGKVYNLACPLIVPLVEEGLILSGISKNIVKYYSKQLLKTPDAIILGCTHYPLLLSLFRSNFPTNTLLIDSGLAVVHQIKFNLCHKGLKGKIRYFVTDSPERFSLFSSFFLKKRIPRSNIALLKL